MKQLVKIIDKVESKIPFSEKSNQKISQATIGWQIEHILLTIDSIVNTLTKSNPTDFKWKFNFTKIIVFITRKIPRGRAKSPEMVTPKGISNANDLKIHLSEIRKKIKELATISEENFFKHPTFGNLKLSQAITFMEIHSNHHLDIIDDILEN